MHLHPEVHLLFQSLPWSTALWPSGEATGLAPGGGGGEGRGGEGRGGEGRGGGGGGEGREGRVVES